jgi:hypothetical protein
VSALDLLRRIEQLGGRVEVLGGSALKLTAPLPLPADLVDAVRQEKAAILCALAELRAPARTLDGCAAHAVTPADVERWWAVAEERDAGSPVATVSMCACCRGPAPIPADPLRDAPYCRRCQPPAPSALSDYAASLAPAIRLTLHETADVPADVALLARVRAVLGEHPGVNHVDLRIVTLDGRRPRVRWRAYASRELRLALGRLLRDHALAARPAVTGDAREAMHASRTEEPA